MSQTIQVPVSVANAAKRALRLKAEGYAGGTATGFARARQLAKQGKIAISDIRTMQAWFARHGPGAKNGGTSYPGFLKFMKTPAKTRAIQKSQFRGAIAWLLWGGTPAYRWVNSKRMKDWVRQATKKA